MKKITLLLGLAAMSVLACVTFRESIEEKLPLTIVRAMRSPDSFELLVLDPVELKVRGTKDGSIPPEREFHGYEILGHVPLLEEGVRSELVELVLKGVQESDGTAAACFNPRHAIRIVNEGRVLDLLICYECLQITIYSAELSDQKGRLVALTSSTVEPEVSRIFTQAGLSTAPR